MLERSLQISFPELFIIAATRGALGVGLGLLLAGRLSLQKRKTIGLPIFVLGVLGSIPIAMRLFHKEP